MAHSLWNGFISMCISWPATITTIDAVLLTFPGSHCYQYEYSEAYQHQQRAWQYQPGDRQLWLGVPVDVVVALICLQRDDIYDGTVEDS